MQLSLAASRAPLRRQADVVRINTNESLQRIIKRQWMKGDRFRFRDGCPSNGKRSCTAFASYFILERFSGGFLSILLPRTKNIRFFRLL
jgi:hypothetical protein